HHPHFPPRVPVALVSAVGGVTSRGCTDVCERHPPDDRVSDKKGEFIEVVGAEERVDGNTMSTTTETTFDGARAEAFGGRIMSILAGSLPNSMVDIDHRTGLFAAAGEGWAPRDELAARAGLTERYVREWLGAVT